LLFSHRSFVFSQQRPTTTLHTSLLDHTPSLPRLRSRGNLLLPLSPLASSKSSLPQQPLAACGLLPPRDCSPATAPGPLPINKRPHFTCRLSTPRNHLSLLHHCHERPLRRPIRPSAPHCFGHASQRSLTSAFSPRGPSNLSSYHLHTPLLALSTSLTNTNAIPS
jgi:hypothetical protein